MKNVVIYTLNYCPYCKRAKKILDEYGAKYHEIDVTNYIEEDIQKIAEALNIQGEITFPQIIIGNVNIGGCDNLTKLKENNELKSYLED